MKFRSETKSPSSRSMLPRRDCPRPGFHTRRRRHHKKTCCPAPAFLPPNEFNNVKLSTIVINTFLGQGHIILPDRVKKEFRKAVTILNRAYHTSRENPENPENFLTGGIAFHILTPLNIVTSSPVTVGVGFTVNGSRQIVTARYLFISNSHSEHRVVQIREGFFHYSQRRVSP